MVVIATDGVLIVTRLAMGKLYRRCCTDALTEVIDGVIISGANCVTRSTCNR